MSTATDTPPKLVSGLTDLRYVPLGELVRIYEARLANDSADRAPAVPGAFNSSI